MSAYPLLSKLSAPASLTPQFRTILLAAGHVAAGDSASAVCAFQHLDAAHVDKAYHLCLLQSAPLIGIPRVLHTAAALQIAEITPSNASPLSDLPTPLTPRQLGEETFRKVYGRYAGRVLRRLETFHPGLEEWVIEHAYGGMLGRAVEGVSMRERELCVVATLAVDPVAGVQLASHLRGAMEVGASREEVEAVVRQTEMVREEAAEGAKAVWDSFERARYAL
eukprot:GFKZ01004025.1.p1 GENE.GFKZ01004025.1~~GFKZ01004025.1.p1  ORF type:complete len:222 (-),score=27.62 GFKZ01004025.1:396-1061(-)